MEKEWIEAIKKGDKKAFEELIAAYQQSALAFARRFIKDEHIAEDIVQEAFAYLYVYRDRYNSRYSLKTYLYTIIRNKCVDEYRKQKRIVSWDESHLEAYENAEDAILQKEKNELIFKCMSSLKEDYKTVLLLIDYEEFTYKEAGKIMGKNLAQIKILVFRARKKLRELLIEEGIFHA